MAPVRSASTGNALQVLSGFGIFGVYFYLSLYVQGILGFSATKAGLVFVPMALLITVIAPASQKVVERLGAGATIAGAILSFVALRPDRAATNARAGFRAGVTTRRRPAFGATGPRLSSRQISLC